MVSSGQKVCVTIDQLKDLMIEFGGNISKIARHLQCSAMKIYTLLDEHHELIELRKKCQIKSADLEVDCSYEILHKLLEACDGNPEIALKAAQTVLKGSKFSRLYSEPQKDTTSSQETLSHLMSISRENALLKEKIAKLESARE